MHNWPVNSVTDCCLISSWKKLEGLLVGQNNLARAFLLGDAAGVSSHILVRFLLGLLGVFPCTICDLLPSINTVNRI